MKKLVIHDSIRRSGKIALFTMLGLLAPLTLQADVYKYVDKHGRVTLTDRKPAADVNYKRLVKTWKGWQEQKSRIATEDFHKNRKRFAPTIDYYAERYQIPRPFLHAVISAESAYDPEAISSTGAVGLMQLMPATAQRYGVTNRRNPSQNIHGGAQYLKDLLEMFDNNLVLALAAYNAGENAVKEHGNKVPPYKETRNYIKKVFDYYKEYKRSMPI